MALIKLSPFMYARPLNEQCHIFDKFNVRFVKFYNGILICENAIVHLLKLIIMDPLTAILHTLSRNIMSAKYLLM